MADDVRIGLIGCGGMGRSHVVHLEAVEGARLTAAADVAPAALEQVRARAPDVRTTTESRELLHDDGIDAVLICTHHHLHRPMAVAAAEAGKHVFVEKPLALTMDDCAAIEEAVRAAGVVGMVGFQARFSPFIDRLKGAVPVPHVTVGQLVDPHWPEGHWANDPVTGGGNVLSQGCHLFDAMYWLNESEPAVVYAEGGNFTHPNTDITDSVCATIRYENGAIATAIVGDFGKPALVGKAFYELFDGHRTATLHDYYSDAPEIRCWNASPETFTMSSLPEDRRTSAWAHGYVQELQAYVDWIRTGIPSPCAATIRDGVRATHVGLAAIQAIQTGAPQSMR